MRGIPWGEAHCCSLEPIIPVPQLSGWHRGDQHRPEDQETGGGESHGGVWGCRDLCPQSWQLPSSDPSAVHQGLATGLLLCVQSQGRRPRNAQSPGVFSASSDPTPLVGEAWRKGHRRRPPNGADCRADEGRTQGRRSGGRLALSPGSSFAAALPSDMRYDRQARSDPHLHLPDRDGGVPSPDAHHHHSQGYQRLQVRPEGLQSQQPSSCGMLLPPISHFLFLLLFLALDSISASSGLLPPN